MISQGIISVTHRSIRDLQKLVDISSPSDDFKTEETNSLEMDQSSNSSFVFPPPPQMRSCRPLSASPYFCVSDSDSHSDSGWGGGGSSSPLAIRHSVLALRGYQSDGSPVNLRSLPSFLPPIGVFWDIENCHVPKGRSALAVVEVIRTKFFKGYREVEFLVVCDVTKENAQVVQELNDAQINLIHVAATCKNAADEKLRQSIRRFADIHGSPAAIILISGDINFASDLSDLKHRKKFHVILLHNNHTSEALILCANEHYNFTSLMENVPPRSAKTIKPIVNQAVEVTISNLPEDKDVLRVRGRLKQLSENCGGRIVNIARSFATIRFSTSEFAARAQRRMDGQDVFGHKICVSLPHRMPDKSSREMSPMKSMSARKLRHNSRSDDENVLSQSPRALRPIMSGFNVLNSIPTPNVFSNLGWNAGFAGAHHSGFGSLMNYQDVSVPPPAVEVAVKGWENGTHQSQLTGSSWNPSAPMSSQRVLTNFGRGLGESFQDAAPGGLRRIRGTHGGLQSSRHGNTNQELNSAGAMPLSSCHLVNGTNPSILKRCRTSSPTADLQQIQTPAVFGFPFPLKRRTPSPYTLLEAETDVLGENSQHFFHPITPSNTELLTASANSSIQLVVTNLDQTIEPKEMKRVLLALFREHVMVIHISVFTQTDGNVAAHVKVPSLQDAQYAISQLHRRKIGFKRMLIAYANGGGPSPQLIRSQIVSLLLEVPGHSLPLFKFRELFESRYLSSISVSDMYKMKDVCIIKEDPSGRMVSLNPDHRNTPSPSFGVGTQDGQLDLPYCTLHPQRPGAGKGWAEQDLEALPNFRIGLNILAERIHTLLHSHNGSLPLPSLPNCYQVQFNKLEEDKDGVPLEHLVSCLPGIEIYQGASCVKYLRWTKVKPNTESQSEELKCVSPPLATQLALFSRELVDLLKTSPHCQLLFNRFIPAYHHHFGRQCRVADYGFTKLIELMEALPNIVQVMGEGNKRVVTLSHRMQVRRFCSDLLRVLKSQATKNVLLTEFPKVYQRVLNKPWDIVDYGVCEMEDLLSELPENSVVVSQQESDVAISIPKREQTLEEIEKTKQFSGEVVELMRHAPQCSMLFSKFIPAYHHHFGHQCRVSDFGFTKLIELFEAIPEVVKIEDASEGERKVSLTLKESLKVLSEQMVALLRFCSNSSLLLSAVPAEYLQLYGHALRPQMYERASLEELMDCIKHVVEVVPTQSGLMITLVNQSQDHQLGLQTRRILMGQPDFKMAAPDFLQAFWRLYKKAFDLRKAEDELADIIKVDNSGLVMTFELKPLQKFACNVYRLLYECKGSIPLVSFDFMYLRLFAIPCQPALLGYPSLEALLRAIPETVLLRGGIRDQRMLILNKDLAAVSFPLPQLEFEENIRHNSNRGKNSVNVGVIGQNNISGKQNKVKIPNVTSDSNRQTYKNSAELLIRNLANGSSHFQTIGEPELDTPAKALRCDSDAPLNQFKLWSPPSFSYYNQACMPPQVNLPPCPPAPPLSSTVDLLSPEKTLLSAHTLPHVVPPHPSELPLPELPSKKSCNSMDSSFGSNEPGSPSQMRRKRRLAAQFHTPIQLP